MTEKRLPKPDRLQLTIKNWGDTVEIYSPRGEIEVKTKDGKKINIDKHPTTITIRYPAKRSGTQEENHK